MLINARQNYKSYHYQRINTIPTS